MRNTAALLSLAWMWACVSGAGAAGEAGPGRITVPGGEVRYVLESDDFDLSKGALRAWVERSAQTVANYYGRFPVAAVDVVLIPAPGRGVRTGKAFPAATPIINVYVGRAASELDLENDWIMVHEMVHLGFPSMPPLQQWMSEGIATYVGTVAPANMGDVSAESVWSEFVQGMPNGLPVAGDRGLDYTPTWGRRYWGGALFCLLGDVEIRKRTDHRYGLRDALRGIIASGATMAGSRRPLADLLRIADQAVGVSVLGELYQEMRATPVHTDLDSLWRELGVMPTGGSVQFLNTAPLAAIRRQITAVAPEIFYSDAHTNEFRIH